MSRLVLNMDKFNEKRKHFYLRFSATELAQLRTQAFDGLLARIDTAASTEQMTDFFITVEVSE